MRGIVVALGIVVIGSVTAANAPAGELMYGCCARPACGKVCKLVCETLTIATTCYGCECDLICIPGPSRPGCKHCSTTCCGCGCNAACDDGSCGSCGCQSQTPKCEFCWRDWCASGCAKPRTVKVLTKFEAEKEISFYHWEVVEADGCCCASAGVDGNNPACRCVYKPAPPEAELGDVFAVTADERGELVAWHPAAQNDSNIQLVTAETEVKTTNVKTVAAESAAAETPVTAAAATEDVPPIEEARDEVLAPLWRRVAHALTPGASTTTEDASQAEEIQAEAPPEEVRKPIWRRVAQGLMPNTDTAVDTSPVEEVQEEDRPPMWRRVAGAIRIPKIGGSSAEPNPTTNVSPEAPAAAE